MFKGQLGPNACFDVACFDSHKTSFQHNIFHTHIIVNFIALFSHDNCICQMNGEYLKAVLLSKVYETCFSA